VEVLAEEEVKRLFHEKNELLASQFVQASTFGFYRGIFPVGSFERKGCYDDSKPNGIAVELLSDNKIRKHMLFDDLNELVAMQRCDFSFLSPVSYFGKNRTSANARWLYAMVFDLDGVDIPQLKAVLHQMETVSGLWNRTILPRANYIVNSGTGIHLYYVFEDPVPLYPQNQRSLKQLKFALTRLIWNRYTSTIQKPQLQGIMQGFRVIGSPSRLGAEYPVTAFRCYPDKWTVDGLIHHVITEDEKKQIQKPLLKGKLSLEEAKRKYPEWYDRRIVKEEAKGRWHIKRDLYDWWLLRIGEEIEVGHRYFGLMALAVYARKCDVSEEELRRDAYGLLQRFDSKARDDMNRFTRDDVEAALEAYNEHYITFPRDDIARLTALPMPVNKRNGRNQTLHLERARAVQNIDYPNGTWRNRNGRPSAEQTVREYMISHPAASKAEVIRSTGLSKPTVYKYWT